MLGGFEADGQGQAERGGQAFQRRQGGVVPPASKRAMPGWVKSARLAIWRWDQPSSPGGRGLPRPSHSAAGRVRRRWQPPRCMRLLGLREARATRCFLAHRQPSSSGHKATLSGAGVDPHDLSG